MPSMISTLATAMQTLLTEQAEKAAKSSKFSLRDSPLSGPRFVQACVFACMDKPLPTLDDFAIKAAACGAAVQPQAFNQRLSQPAAADCLRLVLEQAVKQVITSQPPLVPLLRRFTAVY